MPDPWERHARSKDGSGDWTSVPGRRQARNAAIADQGGDPARREGPVTAEQDIKVLLTVRVYDGDPADAVARLGRNPDDLAWYTLPGDGEFEILEAERWETPDGARSTT